MTSEQETTKLPDGDEGGKETVVASVRLVPEDEKLVRKAAVELDLTRSQFMATAAVEKAREVLKLQRSTDIAA